MDNSPETSDMNMLLINLTLWVLGIMISIMSNLIDTTNQIFLFFSHIGPIISMLVIIIVNHKALGENLKIIFSNIKKLFK
jgi:hypothetical protein